ncbi:MAG: hypothetical protein WCR20_19795 [Verrucomicrobiota bacterium]|jgi:hypothetical protein|nr:hypothetical protein [Verrucomicrobiota bacterium]
MIQNVLRTFGGIDVYGILSLSLFILVFSSAMVWAMLLKKSHLEAMARVPLEDETKNSPSKTATHHEQ